MSQAALAIGVAGLGRIALNSLVSLRFGTVVFAEYAAALSAVILIGSLAAAGPAAATTLGVARRWAEHRSELPSALVRFLLGMMCVFLVPAVGAGLLAPQLRGAVPPLLWSISVTAYVGYQVARAFGYAVQRATAITMSEVAGAVIPLAAVVMLSLRTVQQPLGTLLVIYFVGPLTFLLCFAVLLRRDIRIRPGVISPAERRSGMREGVVFFAGAGSSMAMQYLPVVLAGRMQATTMAAVLFGAVQATAPLLLLSRVYGAVMMPSFAADGDDRNARAHLEIVQPLFLPSLAVALGLAPLVSISLGLRPDGEALSVAALVALITLMQVWATPAVTILSSRKRELIPAFASLGGLGAAALLWAWGVQTETALWLPVGLAVGAVVRSLVPMWVMAGSRVGRIGAPALGNLLGAIGIAGVIVALGRMPSAVAIVGGALLMSGGLVWGYALWSRARSTRADIAR